MALNDKFQLTNYGSEVQKAIDDALIHIPTDLALKAYRDEVLTKVQTIPYTPTQNYHPSTKLYVDNTRDVINTKLDAEITRATNAENVLNTKQVLLFDDTSSSYKYVNLVTLNNSTQALVDENALDAKLAELSLGFFVFYQVNSTTGQLIEGRFEQGVNPYAVVKTKSDLPTQSISVGTIGITLNNASTINVYKYNAGAWTLLATPTVKNGWLFASTSDSHGYYWFVNTWNLIDMNVDMSNYYTKTETDTLLTGYVRLDNLRAVSEITSTGGTITVTGSGNAPRNIEVANGKFQAIIASGSTNTILTRTGTAGTLGGLTKTTSISLTSTDWSDNNIPSEKAIGNYVLNAISGMDTSGFQRTIAAGTANNIVAYSGTAGTLNTLTRNTTINATVGSRTDTNIPTEKAVGTFVENYKPIIITQGNASTSVTTSQLTFWIEQ